MPFTNKTKLQSCTHNGFLSLTGLLFIISFSSLTYAAQPLVLEPEIERFSPILYADILEDPSRNWSIDDVRTPEISAKFIPPTSEFPNFGLTQSAYWFRLTIRNPLNQKRRMKLIQATHYETLSLFTFSADGQRTSLTKDLIDLVGKKSPRRELLVADIDFDPLEILTVYIRLTNTLPLYANLSLWQSEPLQDYFLNESYFLGIAWGMLFLFILVNLLIFLFTKEIIYLYYVIFLGAFLLFRMHVNMWGTLYFSPVAAWNNYILIIFILLFINFGILFYLKKFGVEEKAPQLHLVVKGRLILNVLLLVLPFIIGIQWTLKILFITNLLMFYYMWILIPINWKEGLLSSRLNITALGILYFFFLTHIMRVLGILPSYWFTIYALEFGFIISSLMHFAAVETRVREIFEEKEVVQRQALKNLRHADQMKDQLLANTSHELHTPLHGMIGLVEMVLSSSIEKLSQQTIRQLKLVSENGRRLSRLVGNLLDLSALQSKQVVMHIESVVLYTLVDAVLNLSAASASKKPIRCLNNIPHDLPLVSADPNRLQQILLNLTANALKFTDSGTVIISAHLEKDLVQLEVADTGIGIPEEELKAVFESFNRGESPKIQEQEGLGLGLSICHELVKAHGSHLKVHSVPNKGCIFSFDLPVSTSGEASKTINLPIVMETNKEQTETKPAPFSFPEVNLPPIQQHILVVDDDQTNLEIIFGYLAGEYSITACDTGQEALDVLESDSSIQLMLLDVMMPNLDGFEVCELIREKKTAEEFPILLLTALAREEDITQGYQSGANDYLVKPFRKSELLARIAAQLRLSGYHRLNINDSDSDNTITRQTLVKTLQLSIDIWEAETGKMMFDLAQESKIWGTHIDNKTGTYRSRSLQNYLSEVSLPVQPRWRKVIKTAQFVLRYCPKKSESHKKLSVQLDLLTQHLQEFPL